MGDAAGEQVVGEEEDGDQQDSRRDGRDAGKMAADQSRRPLDEAGLVEAVGHGDQCGEPDKSVPGLTVLGDALPIDNPRHQHQADDDQHHRRGVDDSPAEDPQRKAKHDQQAEHHLAPRQRAQLVQLIRRPADDLAALPHLRRVEQPDHQRQDQQQRNASRGEAQEPLSSADIHLRRLLQDFQRQQIGREGGEEQRTGDAACRD